MTRGLSFSYLWIDSLCIIQDDEADWAQEALFMGDVYSSAACVIAALASCDSTESFFTEQNPLAMSHCLVGVRKKSQKAGGNGGVYALPSRRFTDMALDDIAYSKI